MKHYAVALFYEWTVNIDSSTTSTHQRLDLILVTAVSPAEARGLAIEQSQFKDKPLVYHLVKEVE